MNDISALQHLSILCSERSVILKMLSIAGLSIAGAIRNRTSELVCSRGLQTSVKVLSTGHSSDLAISRNIKPIVRRRSEFDGPSHHDSIEQRLRSRKSYRARNLKKSYTPPADLHNIVESVVVSEVGEVPDWTEVTLTDNRVKYKILSKLASKLDYSVPNSYLWEMNSISDVLGFYSVENNVKTSLESLNTINLPPNLSIRTDYVRFNQETDTFFDGVTAFPKSDTIVSGVKPKKLYKGNKAKKEPYDYVKF